MTCESLVELLYYGYNLLWDSIESEYFPRDLVVSAVEVFLEDYEVYMKLGLPFNSLLFSL